MEVAWRSHSVQAVSTSSVAAFHDLQMVACTAVGKQNDQNLWQQQKSTCCLYLDPDSQEGARIHRVQAHGSRADGFLIHQHELQAGV